jgi:hypothetical protein
VPAADGPYIAARPGAFEGTLVKALARAWRWRRMLDSGEHGTLAEVADAEGIGRSYASRVLRLTLLAPDVIERILDGWPTAGLAQFSKPFPIEWERATQAVHSERR